MENYDDWLLKFGNRLRIERERQNLTRSALAEKANTEQGYIVQIERGARSPSLKTLTNLLSALGISADYLIFGTTEEELTEKESAMQNFANLLRRGDAEDINALYQLAVHMLRHKNQQDLNEFSNELTDMPETFFTNTRSMTTSDIPH
jgi:transcriptional regulator with XRE-family HTH domain